MTSLLVTGGCGFIGCNFIRHVLNTRQDWSVVNVDKLSYAGSRENLAEYEGQPRCKFVKADVRDRGGMRALVRRHEIDVIVHFAAETHVDRSIADPACFVKNNVEGTESLLAAARERDDVRFVQISTDEVYGSLGETERFTEESPLAPNNPYSASKAAADLMCRAYYRTYGLDVCITRCSNNYGPYQFPEKVIPVSMINAMADRPLPLYGDGMNVRDWLYVGDHCRAIEAVIERGRSGEVYNVGGGRELTNLELMRTILRALGKPESLITFVNDRPGHDRRYAMDAGKIRRELRWRPSVTFEEGIRRTVAWYQKNREWRERVTSGEYREYYRRHYAEGHSLEVEDD